MTALTLINARFYTMDPGHPSASGLVIQDGRIIQVLGNGDADIPLSSQTFDLDGRVILPGLIDSHLHLLQYAETLARIDCETATKAECLSRVRDRARATPPGEWVLGHGWNHNSWPEGYGSAGDLDQISRDHPIYLTGKSLHVSWANTTALERCGITASTPDPPGGLLGRDQAGNLTGILFEEAVKLIEKQIPEPRPEDLAG